MVVAPSSALKIEQRDQKRVPNSDTNTGWGLKIMPQEDILESRNTSKGFAMRSLRNLMLAKESFDSREDFHVVTQLVNSLLGIVIVPRVRQAKGDFLSITMVELAQRGWPQWVFTGKVGSESETLGDFLQHLRNATAHGHFEFAGDPDSRHLRSVVIAASNGPIGKAPWSYEIQGDKLCEFCIHLANYIEAHAE